MSGLFDSFASGLYVLDESGESPVRCDNVGQWAQWYQTFSRRRVDRTFLGNGKVYVSTIFLGIDHGFGVDTDRRPVLWETMVFVVKKNGEIGEALECERCNGNREQALALHAEICERVEAMLCLEPDGANF